MAILAIALAIGIAIPLSGLFVKRGAVRGAYKYALAFGNFGYLGDPIVQALFGDSMLSYYKMFTLPLSLLVYSWDIAVLVAEGEGKRTLKQVLNFPLIALFLGIVVSITGLGNYIPVFVGDTLDALKSCMGPVAMLIAGFTVASYGLPEMLKNKKVYVATALRLFRIRNAPRPKYVRVSCGVRRIQQHRGVYDFDITYSLCHYDTASLRAYEACFRRDAACLEFPKRRI